MSIVVITPRTGDLIDLAIAKAHLRVERGDHDDLIKTYIEAAASWLDGPQGWLGRCLGPQTLCANLQGGLTPLGLELRCGPVTEIKEVAFGLTEIPADADLYELHANRVRLRENASWPASPNGPLSITYVAGYPGGQMPGAILSAILLHLTILYEQPEDRELAALERARDDLLSPFRVRTF